MRSNHATIGRAAARWWVAPAVRLQLALAACRLRAAAARLGQFIETHGVKIEAP